MKELMSAIEEELLLETTISKENVKIALMIIEPLISDYLESLNDKYGYDY